MDIRSALITADKPGAVQSQDVVHESWLHDPDISVRREPSRRTLYKMLNLYDISTYVLP